MGSSEGRCQPTPCQLIWHTLHKHTSYSFRLWSDNPQSVASPTVWWSRLFLLGYEHAPAIFSRGRKSSPCNQESLGAAMNPRHAKYQQSKCDIALRLLDKPQYIIFPVPTPTDSYPHKSLWTRFPMGTCLSKPSSKVSVFLNQKHAFIRVINTDGSFFP